MDVPDSYNYFILRVSNFIVDKDYYSLLSFFESEQFRKNELVDIINTLYNEDEYSMFKHINGRYMDYEAYEVWSRMYDWYCDYYSVRKEWIMVSKLIDEYNDVYNTHIPI